MYLQVLLLATAAVACGSPANANATNTLNPKDNNPGNATANASNSTSAASGTAFTEDDFKKAVTALGKADAASKAPHFLTALKDASIATKQEAAMFMAQCWHESDQFQATEEYACKGDEAKKAACDKSYPLTPGKGKTGQHYYGRGYIQLTWDYNYEEASAALFPQDPKKLIEKPDLVATDDEIAWRTAAWFWNKNVHKVATDGKFGATTRAINGALECDGKKPDIAAKRFKYYETIMKAIGETATLDPSGC